MDIGLRAKVKPEVDDRAVKRESGKLRSAFEESVSDLEAAVDFDKVISRVEDMEDRVDGLSEHTVDAAEGAKEMSDALESFDMSALEDFEGGDFAMDVIAGGSGPAGGPNAESAGQDGGGGAAAGVGALSGAIDNNKEQMARVAESTGSMQSMLGTMNQTLINGGGAIALAGIALIMLSNLVSAATEASPLLSQVMNMLGLAVSLFFRPFGAALGQILLPAMAALLQLAAEFNRVFGNEGLRSALGWLAGVLITGMAQVILNVRVTDMIRAGGAIAGILVLKKQIPRLFGILGKRLISGIGSRFAGVIGRFGGTLLAGLGRVLGKALISILRKIGLGMLVRIGARFLPMLGVNVVPVLGQIVSLLLLLDLIIDLLFGWSPIFDGIPALLTWLGDSLIGSMDEIWAILDWGLGAIVDGFVWAAAGLWSVLKMAGAMTVAFFMWLWGALQSFFTSMEGVVEWFEDPSLPGSEAASDAAQATVEGTVDLGEWMWDGTVDLGEWMWGGTTDLGEWMWSGTVELGEWMWSGTVGLGRWMWSGTVTLGKWLWSGTVALGRWLWSQSVTLGKWMWSSTVALGKWMWSSTVALGKWVWSSTTKLGGWMWSSTTKLGSWMWSSTVKLGSWMWSSTIKLGDWMWSSTVKLGQWMWSSTTQLGDWMWSSTTKLGEWMWSSTVKLGEWMWSSTVALGKWMWSSTVKLGKWLWSGTTGLGSWMWSGSVDIAEYIYGSINPSSIISGSISIGSYVSGSIDGFASGGVVSNPTQAVIGEGGEPEAIVPFSKIPEFVQTIASGQSPSGVIPDGNKIPALASGGIATQATMAMIGEGSESEAIMPLSKLQSLLDGPNGGSGGGGGGGGSQSVSIDVNGAGGNQQNSEMADRLEAKLESIEGGIDSLIKELRNGDFVGDITIEADGKKIAEVSSDSKDKYQSNREVNT